MESLIRLYHSRELFLTWTWREVQIRYKQSILGTAWAILQPLVLMVMFSVIFATFLKVPSDDLPYPLFSYAAVLPWTFLSTALNFSIPALVGNMNLVTKIYFPREIIPLGNILAALVDFAVAAVVFAGIMIWYGVDVTWNILWLPVILIVQIMLVVGVALPASALNVFYRDIRFVIPLAMQLWMYASPVIYPVSLVPENIRPLYMLNPMAGILTAYRNVLLHGQPPDWVSFVTSAAISLVLAVGGYLIFKRMEPKFADII